MAEMSELQRKNNKLDEIITESLICPLNKKVILFPVVFSDGFTYDVYSENVSSNKKEIVSENYNLKSLIDEFVSNELFCEDLMIKFKNRNDILKLIESDHSKYGINKALLKDAYFGNKIAQISVAEYYVSKYEKEKDLHTDIICKKVLEWYTKSANQDCHLAQFKLGEVYYKGLYNVEVNYNKAFEFFKYSADQNINSKYYIAKMYKNGIGVEKNISEYIKLLIETAETIPNAKCALAGEYYEGINIEKNEEKAFLLWKNVEDIVCVEVFKWYRKIVDDGNIECYGKLANMYYYGKGVERNYETAFKLYEIAADNGDIYAIFKLGIMYKDGHYVEASYVDAFEMWDSEPNLKNVKLKDDIYKEFKFEIKGRHPIDMTPIKYPDLELAIEGDARAQYDMGNYFENTKDHPYEILDKHMCIEAKLWYELSANSDYSEAQFSLGRFYHENNDTEKAIYWFKKSADQEFIKSYYEIACIYETEACKNDELMFHYMKKAADNEIPLALYKIGCKYYYGIGVVKDEEKAIEYWIKAMDKKCYAVIKMFEIAAEDGNIEAQCNLGLIYKKGSINIIDFGKAKYWYQKAAESGHNVAQVNLGCMYEDGLGGEECLEKAKHYYQLSADQGNSNAMFNLAILYKNEKDYINAFELFEKSAKLGDEDAQYNVGMMYYDGNGVDKDEKLSFKWMKKSAKRGLVHAQYQLAVKYHYGRGVKINEEKAKIWYKKAADQKHEDARLKFDMIDKCGIKLDWSILTANEKQKMTSDERAILRKEYEELKKNNTDDEFDMRGFSGGPGREGMCIIS